MDTIVFTSPLALGDTIELCILDSGGCRSCSTPVIYRGIASTRSQMPSLLDFSVYPNPTEGEINLNTAHFPTANKVSILDINGKLLFSQKIEIETSNYIQLRIEPGIYFIQVADISNVLVKSLIIR